MAKLICLDFGGSSIKYAAADADNVLSLTEKGRLPNSFAHQEEFLQAVYGIVEELGNRGDVSGIAVSYCGELDHRQGMIFAPGTYHYNAGLPLREILEKRFGLPTSVENDGNAALLAEAKYGALQGYDNAGMLVLGTGIGGAFLLDGKLHTGRRGFAGMLSFCTNDISRPAELDNMAIAFVASHYLPREYLIRTGQADRSEFAGGRWVLEDRPLDGQEFFRLLAQGDETAEAVLQDYSENIARFILSLQCILELEAYAVGGGISGQDALLTGIRQALDRVFSGGFEMIRPEIVRAGFGNDANLIGAAQWFRELFGAG